MRIGVTGATGFVGLELTRQLAQRGHQIVAWHRPSSDLTELKRMLGDNQAALETTPGELDGDETFAWMEDCEAIVHSGLWRETASFQAAPTSVAVYAQKNIIGTLKLIEAAIRWKVPRFVFVSTCAVHDKILDDRPLDESHPLWAKSHYGAHKAAIEKFVHSFGFGAGYPICALRPTGIYGLRTPVSRSKWFDIVDDVVNCRETTVERGGKEVHVADVAAAIRLLLKCDTADIRGQAFACYDRYISEYEVAHLAKSISGSRSNILGDPKIPKHKIQTDKIRKLGMVFGGEQRLKQTIELLVHANTS